MDTRPCGDFDDNKNAWIERWWKVRRAEGTETISAGDVSNMHLTTATRTPWSALTGVCCFMSCWMLVRRNSWWYFTRNFSRCLIQSVLLNSTASLPPTDTHGKLLSCLLLFWEYNISALITCWVSQQLSPLLCDQVTHTDCIKLPTQTKIWMDRWRGSAPSEEITSVLDLIPILDWTVPSLTTLILIHKINPNLSCLSWPEAE